MGQNTYAEWFINTMLGWIRWVANGIAGMFQSSNAHGSSTGGDIFRWFSDNWITLLIVLVVFGVLMDWVIWMIRWRPYWLWFRKKRVLLDDDIDAILSDEELMKKFAPPQKARPHFSSSQLGRGGRPIPKDELTANLYDPQEFDPDYDEEFDVPDIEDPYDGADPIEYDTRVRVTYDDEDDDEYDDIDPETAEFTPEESEEDYEKEQPFDQLYSETYNVVPMRDEDEVEVANEDEDPDISFLEADDAIEHKRRRGSSHAKRPGLFARIRNGKHKGDDEDPFSVDDADFYDPDDEADFLQRLQQAPPVTVDDDGFSALYPDHKAETSESLTGDDWRTGYSVYNSTVEPPAPSRRVRRQRREQHNDDDE